jgi:hypothetical protein
VSLTFWRDAAWVLIAVALGAVRIAGHTGIPFQAVAHVYVGAMFGAYWAGRRELYAALAGGLTAIEVICFIFFRHFGSGA